MSVNKTNEVFNYLLETGCCRICCIRYLGYKNVDFNDINSYFNKKEFIKIENENIVKKNKSNPCTVCLGLLQEETLQEVADLVSLSNANKYDCKYFTCSISMPACILIREHSIRIAVEDKFPSYFWENEEVALNKAWKWLIRDKLAVQINKIFENSDTCNFSINIALEYEDDFKELVHLKQLLDGRESIKKSDFSSRKFISGTLACSEPSKFKQFVVTPPQIPTCGIKVKSIECKHTPIYIAGRYCKYSRELSQSPWIIDGVKTMETSVQEIIFEEINKLLSIPLDLLKFTASGREDCDVRCLGKGRPFYIEISDPKVTFFDRNQFFDLQTRIKERKLISVRDLQLVDKSEITRIKEGEEMKTKEYVALCIIKSRVTEEMIDKINNAAPITVKQKTPIRVLHRRPLAVRNKKIVAMTGKLISGKDRLFQLNIITEAGTYIKEFVHGDFGRTKPSIGCIIGNEADILALDVIGIDLDWPKEIPDL